jgi:hypothetical protein
METQDTKDEYLINERKRYNGSKKIKCIVGAIITCLILPVVLHGVL